MIDWHTHILPKMDDGSSDCDESVLMLKMLSQQGVKRVIATPHFVANNESVDKFLQRRRQTYDILCKKTNESLPDIILGAEVKYYSGISKLEKLEKLCIEGTLILLLEMPFSRWTEYTVRELEEMALTSNVTIVIAHIERYVSKNNLKVLQRLYHSGVLMQINANCFDHLFVRAKICRLIESGAVCFLGSDCHNSTSRQPQIDKALCFLAKKYGKEFINRFNEQGLILLDK